MHGWGAASGMDDGFVAQFTDQVNDDLNMPRALAVVWELVRSDLPAGVKKGTLLHFDRVLGLGLAEWQPAVTVVPDAILALVDARQTARKEKRWQDADRLRDEIQQAGYELEDTAQGARVRPRQAGG